MSVPLLTLFVEVKAAGTSREKEKLNTVEWVLMKSGSRMNEEIADEDKIECESEPE